MVKELNNVKALKEYLNNADETSPIFLGAWNGYSDTYTVADHIMALPYEAIENDFFGTRGKMDKRLFNKEYEGKDVIFIGSKFHQHIDNKEIDFPDNPNEPIELINGEDGDHDLFWKSNDFKTFLNGAGKTVWCLANNQFTISYYPHNHTINVHNYIDGDDLHFEGKCIGLEDYFDIMKACKIEKQWRIG